MIIPPRMRPSRHWASGILFMTMVCHASFGIADEQSDRRVLMGLKLFPMFVAADQDLAEKRNRNGQLDLLVVYHQNTAAARNAAKRLSAIGTIKNFPVRVTALPYAQLNDMRERPPAALFLLEPPTEALSDVVRFGIQHQRIVLSPFAGDVDKGVAVGIFIADRILPLVNPATLAMSAIRLNPFLLEIALTNE